MISTDFAANELLDDAWISFKLLFQPARWLQGKEIQDAKTQIQDILHLKSVDTSLFLTGRASIYYFLQTLNLPKNSDVMIQAFTCEAVPLPIIANGLNPIYVDIEDQTFSIDIEDLKKKLTLHAKVLILQHTYGLAPKFRNEILTFAKEKNLIVLEDLAHGFDPELFKRTTNDQRPTTLLLSFGRSKAFSSVFGGAIVTNDKKISTKLTTIEKQLSMPTTNFILRTLLYKPLTVCIKLIYDIYIGKLLHKLLNALHLLIPEITNKEKQGEYDAIFAKAYPNALAVLLLHQFKKYPETVERRAKNVQQYNEHFKNKPALNYSLDITNKYLSRFPILVENRDGLLQKAAQKNIYLGKWYDQVVSPKQLDLKKVLYTVGSCPKAENISQKIVNLPINITGTQLKIILTVL